MRLIAEIAREKDLEILTTARIFADLDFDSLSVLELVIGVEERCGVLLDIGMMQPDPTIEDLYTQINSQ